MPDPKKPDDIAPFAERAQPTQAASVKPGRFGVFADVFRARWFANRPHMRRIEVTDASATPAPSGNSTVEKRSVDTGGTRLIRPEDHE